MGLVRGMLAAIAAVLMGIGAFFLATIGLVVGLAIFVVLFILFKIYARRVANEPGSRVFFYSNVNTDNLNQTQSVEQPKIYLNGQEVTETKTEEPEKTDSTEVYDLKPDDYSITDKEK